MVGCGECDDDDTDADHADDADVDDDDDDGGGGDDDDDDDDKDDADGTTEACTSEGGAERQTGDNTATGCWYQATLDLSTAHCMRRFRTRYIASVHRKLAIPRPYAISVPDFQSRGRRELSGSKAIRAVSTGLRVAGA
eukprot:1623665-Rhodomonas_salina.2